jgi:hypothetical protein
MVENKIVEIKELVGKQLILISSNGMRYSGTIIEYGTIFIKIKQDSGQEILLNINTIDKIIPQEVKE